MHTKAVLSKSGNVVSVRVNLGCQLGQAVGPVVWSNPSLNVVVRVIFSV